VVSGDEEGSVGYFGTWGSPTITRQYERRWGSSRRLEFQGTQVQIVL
jgi:hypothetical protein